MSALPPILLEFLAQAPPSVNGGAILRQWQALRSPYGPEQRRPPLPLWARRGLSDDGATAWAALEHDAPEWRADKAMCVYLHVPFCARRCAFCDCYSFALRTRAAAHLRPYVGMLEQEIDAWAGLGPLAKRPISTVHLGGGTPTLVDEAGLTALAARLRERLGVGPGTEWALESTTSELTDSMMATLEGLGFTRLHLGIQTLQDEVRGRIGRREPGATALAKVERAVSRGWVVSVDVILGLPGQTAAAVAADLASLEDAGVDGFSLYELQFSRRNHQFARRSGLLGREHLGSYLLFQTAAQTLEGRGYRKTLFNHWARAKDANLYFTFPERDEDCLALGTIADGVLGDYHYRHPEYAAYCHAMRGGGAGLQGGLRRTPAESRLRPLEVSLLSGRPSAALFAALLGADSAARLFAAWEASALIEVEPERGRYVLTGNGSWLTGNMLAAAMAARVGA
ncbi:MAG: radical SAM protein [Anaerolineae bacterium]